MHYYPQYSLDDLRQGRIGLHDFVLLYAGMVDNEDPSATEPPDVARRRMVEEAHRRAVDKARQRLGWRN